MGPVIGALVLILSVGFVVVMAISEWSADSNKGVAALPNPGPLPGKGGKKKKSASKGKPKAKKKK